MRGARYTDIDACAARALPFLQAREAEHCLPIGLITTLQRGETSNPTPPYLALVEDDAVIVAPLVAALSQRLLDEGHHCTFLFTDLANPTSNHIYQQVGYEPVSDVSVYTFQQAR